MSTAKPPRRVFYCAECGNRSRGLPMVVVALNVWNGGRQLHFQLDLCPRCKLAWIDQHFTSWSPARRRSHETALPYAVLQRNDVLDLETERFARRRARKPPPGAAG
jgi:hypothetical protein